MKSITGISWSNVALPSGKTRMDVELAYEAAYKDLSKNNGYFKKYFDNKKNRASVQMMTLNIFNAVESEVFMHPSGIFDVQGLLKFISNDDRQLFSDVCTFVYEFFDGKPANQQTFIKFKSLLTYYLCRVGF